MALRELTIDGFGHFHDHVMRDLGPGLTVLYGPNEAGKSTLTAFLTYVLFGPVRGERPVALAGGRPGGRLVLAGDDGQLVLERFEGSPPAARRADGAVLAGDDAIRGLLGGLDRAMYRAVWSFALDDLRSFERMGEEELRDRLFTGAVAGAGRSVSAAVARLGRRQEALWRPRASSVVGDAERRLAEVEEGLRDARRRAGKLGRLQADRDEAVEEHRLQVDARVRAEGEARRWTALVDALPHHKALAAARARLEELPVGREVGEAALAEVRRVDASLVLAGAKAEAALGHVTQRTAERDALPPPSPLLALAADVAALSRHAAELPVDREDALRQQASRARRRVEAALVEAGLPDVDGLARLDRSPASVRRLREGARAAEEHETRLHARREAEAEAGRLAEELRRVEEHLAGLPRDEQAMLAAPVIEGLRRDEARATDARRCAEAVARRQAEVCAEIDGLAPELGPEAAGANSDLVARAVLGDAVRALRSAEVASEARRASARELFARRTERVTALRGRLDKAPPAGVPPEGVERVVRGIERALEARAEAARADGAAEDDGLALSAVVGRLGAGWGADALARARTDAGTAQRLRSTSRDLGEARRAEDLAASAVDAAATAASREGNDVTGAGPGLREVDEREVRLDEADAVIRAREEARARAAGAGVPPWATWSGVGTGVALLVLGVLAAVFGPSAVGVMVALLGLVVAAGSWLWLRRGASSPADADTDASEALAALGLGAGTSSADVARLRAELRRARRVVTLREEHGRAVVALGEQRARREEATRAWAGAVTTAGWPAEVAPEALEVMLADVLRGRELLDRRSMQARRAGEQRRAWEAWLAAAGPVATALDLPAPDDAAAARALVDAVRDEERAREEASSARRDLSHALEATEAELEAAASELERAEQSLAEMAGQQADVRAKASALAVPESVPLDLAEAWLSKAGRLAELQATARDLQAQRDGHEEVAAAWEARRAEVVTGRLGCDGPESLADAEARCRRAAEQERAWQEADGHRRGLAKQHEDALARRRVLEAELAARSDVALAWPAARAAASAPEGLSPAGLDDLLTAAQRARTAQDEVEEHEAAAVAVAEAAAALLAEVGPVAEALGTPVPTSLRAAHEVVRQAERRLAEDRERAAQRERADGQVREAEVRVVALQAKHDELRGQLRALLDRHDAEDVHTLERLHAAHVERVSALQEVTSAVTARRAALGGLADDAAALAALDAPDVERWRVEVDLATTAAEEAQAAADAAVARRTQRSSEIDDLGGSSEIASLDAEAASLHAGLDARRHELATLALAQALLERTLKRFREAHQPQILRRASGYLATATRRAYTAVEPDAQGRGLLLVDREGGRRRAEILSTGTAELLYLVLRLGLVHDLASGSVPVPMVLDDVLVNLDPERATAVADLLAEVATEHQVLLLTCRPEARDLLAARIPDARVVELPRFAGRESPAGGSVGVGASTESGGLHLAAERILDVLARESDALGRQEILDQTGIPAGSWTTAITQLKDAGLVVQEGKKRGARYRAAT